jgi:hypothetical protein
MGRKASLRGLNFNFCNLHALLLRAAATRVVGAHGRNALSLAPREVNIIIHIEYVFFIGSTMAAEIVPCSSAKAARNVALT